MSVTLLMLQALSLVSCVVALLVTECGGHYSHHNKHSVGTQAEIENNNIWGAMMSHLNYKLSLKNKFGSSFQSIKRFLKMSKPQKPWPQRPMKPWPQKPMKPWPQKPMKPWPQKPMKPWPQKPVNPWVPLTQAPLTTPPPPPPPTTTTPPPPPPTTTTTPPPTTTTTTTTTSAASTTTTPVPIDIDFGPTEDYFPFPAGPLPITDIDIGVGPETIFRPDTRVSPASASVSSQIVTQRQLLPLTSQNSYPLLPFYQYINYVPNVIRTFHP